MSITVIRPSDDQLDVVAAHVAGCVQQMIARIPLVPDALAVPEQVRAALEALDERVVVAVDSGHVVGHLGWHDFADARRTGRAGAWVPEFAHSAENDAVRDALFAHASCEWERSGRQTLMVTTLAQDHREWWHLNGFGTFLHDTVRAPHAFALGPESVSVRPAVESDALALQGLDELHCAHYALPPTFMVEPTPWTAEEWSEHIGRHPGLVQVAATDRRPYGFIRVEFGHAELRLLQHPRSATVTGIFVEPAARRSNVGSALLSAVADATGRAGADVLTADHETTNPNARRFWPRHITTVAVSMMRVLERW